MSKASRRVRQFAFSALALAAASSAHAGLVYWDIDNAVAGPGGAAPVGSWDTTTGTNWGNSGGTVAGAIWNNGAGDTAVFAAGTTATSAYTVTVNSAITLAGITREEGSPTIVSLAANPWTFTAGALAVDTGSGTLVVNAFFNGSPTGTITKSGTGILSPGTSQSAFKGKWVVNGGSLSFAGNLRPGVDPGVVTPDLITLNNGARLRSSTAAVTFLANQGITLGSGGGGFDQTGTVQLTWAGPITGASGNNLIITAASGAATILTNTTNNWAGDVTLTSGRLGVGAAGVIPDTANVAMGGGNLDLQTFDETIKSITGTTGTITLNGQTLTLDNPVSASNSTVISGTLGKLVKNGSGSQNLGATNLFTGGVTLNTGTLGITNDAALGTGALTVNNTPKLVVGNTTARSITNAVTLNGDLTVDDTLDAAPGALTSGTGAWTITGGNRTITVNRASGAGYTVTIGGVITQDVAGRGLTKAGNGTLQINNSANLYTGSTTLSAGVLGVDADGKLGNGTGTFNMSGGTFNMSADRGSTAAGQVTNPLNVTAATFVTQTSAAAAPIMNFTSGTVGGTGKLTFRNDAASATTFNPRFTGSGFNFAGNIDITNGAFGTTALQSFNILGTSHTFSGDIGGDGSYIRNATSATGVNSGGETVFTGNNSYTGLTNVTRGRLKAAAAGLGQSLGGTSSVIVGTNGVLELGADDEIKDTASMSLSGGKIETGGFDEGSFDGFDAGIPGMGTASLTANSILDMGSGSSTLAFSDSNTAPLIAAWTSSTQTLSIWNWSGNVNTGAGPDRVYFGSSASGLDPSQYARISFYTGPGTGLIVGTTTILSTGEVVPVVPEPASLSLLGLAAGGLLARRRRSC